jgi:hypothetical protein
MLNCFPNQKKRRGAFSARIGCEIKFIVILPEDPASGSKYAR